MQNSNLHISGGSRYYIKLLQPHHYQAILILCPCPFNGKCIFQRLYVNRCGRYLKKTVISPWWRAFSSLPPRFHPDWRRLSPQHLNTIRPVQTYCTYGMVLTNKRFSDRFRDGNVLSISQYRFGTKDKYSTGKKNCATLQIICVSLSKPSIVNNCHIYFWKLSLSGILFQLLEKKLNIGL